MYSSTNKKVCKQEVAELEKTSANFVFGGLTIGLLICSLISENEGLEKSRSFSNLRKISGPAHLDFFSVCHLDFFQVYGINLAFFSRWRSRKKSRFAGPEIFLRFETNLDISRPWFSEIKVQIKRPYVRLVNRLLYCLNKFGCCTKCTWHLNIFVFHKMKMHHFKLTNYLAKKFECH